MKRQINIDALYYVYDYRIIMRSCRQAKNLTLYLKRIGLETIQRGRMVYYKKESEYIPFYIKK